MFNNKFFNVFWERKILFLLTSFLVFAGILGGLYFWPKTYMATSKVMIEARQVEPVSGSSTPTGVNTSYLSTQIEVIQSSRVASRAIALLKLDSNEPAQERYRESGSTNQTFTQYYAEQMQKGVTVKGNRDSNVIDITYKTSDPTFAAAVANAFARAYIETNLELRVQPAKEFSEWFEARIDQARTKLKQNQRQFSDLQRKAGITSADERLDVENARLQELSSQLVMVQGQLSDSEKKSGAARRSQTYNGQISAGQITAAQSRDSESSSVPEVQNSPIVQSLRSEIARAEARRAEQGQQLGVRHPQMQRVDSEIELLKKKLSDELAVATGTVDKQFEVMRGREQALRAALAEQKEKVMRVKRDRDEIAVFSRELDNSQRAHDLITSRLTQTTLESQANLPSALLLDEAVAPKDPISPKTSLGIFMALLLAPLVGLAAVLIHEALDRRVRSSNDIEEATGVRVLCIVGRGRPSRTLSVIRTIAGIFKSQRDPAILIR